MTVSPKTLVDNINSLSTRIGQEIHNVTTIANTKADWQEQDSTSRAFIKNKPDLDVIQHKAVFSSKLAYDAINCKDYCVRETQVSWGDDDIKEPKGTNWKIGSIILFIIPCTDGTYYVSYQKVLNQSALQPLGTYYVTESFATVNSLEAVKQTAEDALNRVLLPGPKGDTGPQGPKGDKGDSLDPNVHVTFQKANEMYINKSDGFVNLADRFNSIYSSKSLKKVRTNNISSIKQESITPMVTSSSAPISGFITYEDANMFLVLNSEVNYDYSNKFTEIYGA